MKSENLKYCKVRKVKNPCRAHYDDAGFDVFVPEDLTWEQMQEKFQTTGCQTSVSFADDGKTITAFNLEPGESVLIPSGLKMNIPKGFAVVAFNKSGVAAKKGLLVGSCVTGNTVIKTNKGNFTAITLSKDFCEKQDIMVASKNLKTGKEEYQKCDGFRQVQRGKCIRVTFDNETVIEGDENHLIWFENRWIPLKDL